jgi:hypothetical protein
MASPSSVFGLAHHLGSPDASSSTADHGGTWKPPWAGWPVKEPAPVVVVTCEAQSHGIFVGIQGGDKSCFEGPRHGVVCGGVFSRPFQVDVRKG